nr:MAG TPA: hypothetical protein [Caudoviricetes sp.]
MREQEEKKGEKKASGSGTEPAVTEIEDVATETGKAETATSTKSKEEAETEALIYIGPAKSGIAQNTVFADGRLDDRALKVQSMTPRAALLFVPISQLPAARKKLQREGTAMQLAYKALKDREE